MSQSADDRLSEILATIEAMVGGELERRIPISPVHDELDAVAYSVNILAGELGYAGRIKSAFLRNVSHELRTPVASLVGLADLLARAPMTEAPAIALRIRRNAFGLLHLVNDLLDLSRLDADSLEVDRERVSVAGLIHEALQTVEVQSAAKGLHTVVSFSPGAPAEVVTDPRRLVQILTNLVGNAVKFTERGEVRIDVTRRGGYIAIDVADTGVGILPDDQDRIFAAFSRGRRTRAYEGTGLGLELSRRLARRLDGDVVLVSSEPGQGSTFRLTLPGHEAGAASAADRLDADLRRELARMSSSGATSTNEQLHLKGMRILLAEDDPDTRFALQELLSLAGAQVAIAENGLVSYERALAENFDIVLMDVQMPDLDGLEATRRLRQAGYRGPVIALTASTAPEQRQKCLDAGYDAYHTKPITFERLAVELGRLGRTG